MTAVDYSENMIQEALTKSKESSAKAISSIQIVLTSEGGHCRWIVWFKAAQSFLMSPGASMLLCLPFRYARM